MTEAEIIAAAAALGLACVAVAIAALFVAINLPKDPP